MGVGVGLGSAEWEGAGRVEHGGAWRSRAGHVCSR